MGMFNFFVVLKEKALWMVFNFLCHISRFTSQLTGVGDTLWAEELQQWAKLEQCRQLRHARLLHKPFFPAEKELVIFLFNAVIAIACKTHPDFWLEKSENPLKMRKLIRCSKNRYKGASFLHVNMVLFLSILENVMFLNVFITSVDLMKDPYYFMFRTKGTQG